MAERDAVIRSLHDVGLAAWFGATLAGAVAVDGAAAGCARPEAEAAGGEQRVGALDPGQGYRDRAQLIGGAGYRPVS
jgi:hypothetical protein